MNVQLLIQARPSTVFAYYAQPFHWNLGFQSIVQAYLDRTMAVGARGHVHILGAGKWRMEVARVYDDHMLELLLYRWPLRLTFCLCINPVATGARVSHQLSANLPGQLLLLLCANRLRNWLRLNLHIVQTQCRQLEQETSAPKIKSPKARPKVANKVTKARTAKASTNTKTKTKIRAQATAGAAARAKSAVGTTTRSAPAKTSVRAAKTRSTDATKIRGAGARSTGKTHTRGAKTSSTTTTGPSARSTKKPAGAAARAKSAVGTTTRPTSAKTRAKRT